jgi:hypothetical protein
VWGARTGSTANRQRAHTFPHRLPTPPRSAVPSRGRTSSPKLAPPFRDGRDTFTASCPPLLPSPFTQVSAPLHLSTEVSRTRSARTARTAARMARAASLSRHQAA